ncbi:hypothetical protein EYF80_036913 [Liparis tanakae]|uniref:Uncharacterized protein n=1 Tax=Liparis tanakae TaxID=230148 RepID=A0A4Z2GHV6_9TELE|nr:hypothetical protein EYF80_036913 [Liparis tanakae]
MTIYGSSFLSSTVARELLVLLLDHQLLQGLGPSTLLLGQGGRLGPPQGPVAASQFGDGGRRQREARQTHCGEHGRRSSEHHVLQKGVVTRRAPPGPVPVQSRRRQVGGQQHGRSPATSRDRFLAVVMAPSFLRRSGLLRRSVTFCFSRERSFRLGSEAVETERGSGDMTEDLLTRDI